MTITGPTLLGPGPRLDSLRGDLLEFLKEVDTDFVPPLSARDGTTTSRLGPGGPTAPEPRSYLADVLHQYALLVLADGDLVGMMSFVADRSITALPTHSPCTYLSTIAVRPAFRGRGVGRLLYGALVTLPEPLRRPHIVTRTWSTNAVHLPLLDRFGFTEVHRIVDDRGAGVDTVYYARSA